MHIARQVNINKTSSKPSYWTVALIVGTPHLSQLIALDQGGFFHHCDACYGAALIEE